jgi:aspartyl-tRNA(Asn)/glutamyl-tRNA(Gln) amidotransferase subunit C
MLTKDDCLRLARLSRIRLSEEEAAIKAHELSSIFDWIDQLNKVDVEGIPTFIDEQNISMIEKEDRVSDGNKAADIVANACESKMNMFAVPKVVE